MLEPDRAGMKSNFDGVLNPELRASALATHHALSRSRPLVTRAHRPSGLKDRRRSHPTPQAVAPVLKWRRWRIELWRQGPGWNCSRAKGMS